MNDLLFYKNDRMKWRWEGTSKIIIYHNDKYWALNETASLIFYYCEGVNLSQIIEFFKRADLNNDYIKFIIEKFLNILLKEEVIVPRFNKSKAIFGNNLMPKYNLSKFVKPEIKSFELGCMDYLKFDRPSSPLRIFFTVTQECNLECKHCYNPLKKDNNIKIDLSMAKEIIDRIKKAGVFEIILTGGEVFLNPYILTIIDYILLNRMKVRVNTNGLLLKDEEIKELRKRKDITLSLGMDGVSSRSNDFIRGEGNFKKAIAVLEKLSEDGIDTYINFAATHRNFSDILRLRGFFRNFNVSRIIVNIFIRTGRGHKYSDVLALNRLEFSFLKALDYFNKNKKDKPLMTIVTSCYGGHIEANVDYKGFMFFCELLHYPLGNILKKDIEEIWNSPQMLSLIDVDKFGFPCGACFFRKRCRGSCRAEAFSATGDIYAGNPYCFKGKIISNVEQRLHRWGNRASFRKT